MLRLWGKKLAWRKFKREGHERNSRNRVKDGFAEVWFFSDYFRFFMEGQDEGELRRAH